MPRINLTIEEHEAIRPVLEAHRLQAQLKAERIRTLLAVRLRLEAGTQTSWTFIDLLDILSDLENSQ